MSKGTALAAWCETRGYAPAEVLAAGDNYNDLEMLAFAGVPVVMGNAVPGLLGAGFHVTATHDEAGLARAIERFVLAPGAPRNEELETDPVTRVARDRGLKTCATRPCSSRAPVVRRPSPRQPG